VKWEYTCTISIFLVWFDVKSCFNTDFLRGVSLKSSILFQHSKQNMPLQHNKFNKDRQPEGQMPIMLATVLLQLTVTVTEMAK